MDVEYNSTVPYNSYITVQFLHYKLVKLFFPYAPNLPGISLANVALLPAFSQVDQLLLTSVSPPVPHLSSLALFNFSPVFSS